MILQQIMLRPSAAVGVATFTSLGSAGTGSFSNDVLNFTPNKALAAGTLLVASYAQNQYNNIMPAVTDTKGNTWQTASNYSNGGMFFCKLTTALTTSDLIKFTGSGTSSRITTIEQFAIPVGMNVYKEPVVNVAGNNVASPPVTISGLTNRTYLFVRHGVLIHNGFAVGNFTPTAGFTNFIPVQYSSASASEYIYARSEYTIATGTGITSNPGDTAGSTSSANTLAAFYLAP